MRTQRPFTNNGRNYTEFFAWFPRRVSSGKWVWFNFYYIRPNRNGQGVVLTSAEIPYDVDD